MPTQDKQNLVVVVVEFRVPVAVLPFKSWKQLKDYARSALKNNHEPGGTEMSLPSTDGRSVGYVICKAREDAPLIYNKMLELSDVFGARVHWFDTEKSENLVQCNCPGTHTAGFGFDYRNYARMVESHDPVQSTSPVMYTQPAAWVVHTAAPGPSSMQALTNDMSNLAVNPTDYSNLVAPQSMPYLTKIPPSYGQSPQYSTGYATSSPGYAVQATAAASYALHPQYSSGYVINSQGYPEQIPAVAAYSQYPQHPSGYITHSQGYPVQASATAAYGQASASASYGVNSSGHLVNTTQGYIQTERNVVIMRNLDPKTTEKDVRKELDRVVVPVSVKIKKYDHVKKKSVSAIATFNNFQEAKLVKDYFERKPRHIRNRQVSVSLGKDSIPPPPPMVLSSTEPN